MWFRRKRKPVKLQFGDPVEIRSGGLKHTLILTEISSTLDGCTSTALLTGKWSEDA